MGKWKSKAVRAYILLAMVSLIVVPAFGQVQRPQYPAAEYPEPDQPVPPPVPRSTPTPEIDQFGQRQSPSEIGRDAGIQPMGRIANRIQNRVPSRLETRIGRNNRPQVDTRSPFTSADQSIRRAGRPRTR